MTRGNFFRQVGQLESNWDTNSSCEGKSPNVNWLHHASVLENFSCQKKFLSSNFHFSLPGQNPCSETKQPSRSMACKIQSAENLGSSQIKKAWDAASGLHLKCRSYVRPGLTAPVVHNVGASNVTSKILYSSKDLPKTSSLWSSSARIERSFSSSRHENLQTHQEFSGYQARGVDSISYVSNSLPGTEMSSNRVAFMAHRAGRLGTREPSTLDTASRACPEDESSDNNGVQVVQSKGFGEILPDITEDDDILQNIDIDQIVLEHYQASGTPQSSAPKLSPFTPAASKDNILRPNENSLPSELCIKCIHDFKVALCPEAASHLQVMKDRLIAVSNELLDNADELSHQESDKLRQERLQLKELIQHLEKYLNCLTRDEERQRSHFSASTTATKGFNSETQLTHTMVSGLRIDPVRLDAPSHMSNELGSRFSSNPSPIQCPSTDRVAGPPCFVEKEAFTPKLIEVNYIDGSSDKRWSSRDFPWIKKLEANNKKVFGNHSFRPNQREIINATMSGNDVFVLMPTGGGKSLTYQLPALICPGITLVVSPLVSLIQDQIMHLLQANIAATYLSASMEWNEQQQILRELTSDLCKYKLLYVTPEKIAKSDFLLRHLESLYMRESLARIVIDEAHCVSQWGHDFRPDYQGLGVLKQKFPNIPVLALTATATASVKEDVVQALGLVNCIVFRQSFNRPNLWFSIMLKTKRCMEDIDKFIKENHFDECGIIYCLSRMDCEKVAEKLQEFGHKAAFYHGSMDPQQRAFVQRQWSKDEINIICATVAFGMGINKPDVRFVIHHSLPKSIEGYHQECGRAGRDDQRSSCVLYYSYSDYIRVKHMLSQGAIEQSPLVSGLGRFSGANSGRILETNIENLSRMVSYCENDVDCRRLLQLVHFGEKFDPSKCRKTCDNCCKMLTYIEKDVTDIAKQLVELVKSTGQHHSSSHILDVFRGSLNQSVKKYRHDSVALHGAGKHLSKNEASRILHHLVVEDLFVEDAKKSDFYGSVSSVLKVNESKARSVCFGQQRIIMRFAAPKKADKLNKSEATPAKAQLLQAKISPPPSENPAQPECEVDVNLSAKLYTALRMLRTVLVKEAGEGVMAYHIFGNATLQQISKRVPRTKEELLEISGIGKAKVSKYGDRVLETIKSTIKEYQKTDKNGSCSSENGESTKRRRDSIGVVNWNSKEDDDFIEAASLSKKRVANGEHEVQCIDIDLDGEDCIHDMERECSENQGGTGRVLPTWSNSRNRDAGGSVGKLFDEFAFKEDQI